MPKIELDPQAQNEVNSKDSKIFPRTKNSTKNVEERGNECRGICLQEKR